MIKIINKNSKEKEKINYRQLGNFCNSCGSKIESNLLLIRQDSGNSGTIISLCDKCLQELKKKIEALEGVKRLLAKESGDDFMIDNTIKLGKEWD